MNKLVLIGLGSIGKKHIYNIKKIYPECTIAVLSPSGKIYEKSDDYISLDSLQSALEFRPEAAIVASPAPFHAEHIAFFQRNNVPVLSEKPLAASAIELIRHQVNSDKIAVAYCLRYLPATKIVKEILDEMLLGDIYNVVASVGQYLPDWRKDKDYKSSVSASSKLGGGAVLELSHEIDLINYLFGDLEVMSAFLRKDVELGLDVEEIADIVLLSNKKIYCTIHLDFIQKVPSRFISIIGRQGRVDWDIIKNSVLLYNASGKTVLYKDTDFDKNIMYIDMLQDFIKLIKCESNSCVSFQQGMQVMSVIDAIKSKAIWG
ncbi:Gfo/Idh/MocA family oxidoreductase [Erwinia sp. P6884]|uniref:Gfo/Idh/MocA family protein n=1 Tax=Erwinia sp. P6884 TaxID=3141450 RepID=UPI00319465CF